MKKIAVLPSLLTLGNTFCGFLAILKTTDAVVAFDSGQQALFTSHMETAVLLIFLAMIFDALDGKVARLTNQATDFGAQLDSLSDAITFGVAPAVLAKALLTTEGVKIMPFLERHPRLLFAAVATYALFAVMRLARFNVESAGHEEEAHDRFKGLPTPAAGGLVAAAVLFWLHRSEEIVSLFPSWASHFTLRFLPWALVFTGLAMVSPLPYPHFMNFLFKRRKSFLFFSSLVLVIVLIVISPETSLFAALLVYILSGPCLGFIEVLRGRGKRGGPSDLLKGPGSMAS